MRTYGQYCPIARASEILAERWTPIIVRNLLRGATSFTEIAADAPGIPRSLLASRLRELEEVGIVEVSPNLSGRGSRYRLTTAGRELDDVIMAMGSWGDRWLGLTAEHSDPGVVLHAWISWYLAEEALPNRRVVARFDFTDQPIRGSTFWVVFDGSASEVCRKSPGLDEHLIVTAESQALAEWHLGRLQWREGIDSGRILVAGDPSLAAALPRWNKLSLWARRRAPAGTAR